MILQLFWSDQESFINCKHWLVVFDILNKLVKIVTSIELSTTDTFIINSFCLVPESSYNLTLNVSGFNSYSINAITGFTYSNIITIGSELVLTLNRSSGTVGTINPFYLSASVSDPDNSSAVIDVSWNYKGQSQSFNKTNSKTLEITTDNLTKEKFYIWKIRLAW